MRSISEHPISCLALNNTGDWVAVGSREQGQLLVWEWQSETYVMKQQGHAQAMTCLAYSPDAQYIVTGGEDGKVIDCLTLIFYYIHLKSSLNQCQPKNYSVRKN
jgi:WD40 repeat protein